MVSCSCTSPRYASGELRDLVFAVSKRGQDRRSGSLMSCMLKQIHFCQLRDYTLGHDFLMEMENRHFDRTEFCSGLSVLLSVKSLG